MSYRLLYQLTLGINVLVGVNNPPGGGQVHLPLQTMRDSFRETLISYLRSLNSVTMDERLVRQIVSASLNSLFASQGSPTQKVASFTQERLLSILRQGEASLASLHRLQNNSDLSSVSLRDLEQLVLSLASLGLEEEGILALNFLEQKIASTPLSELKPSGRAQMWSRVSETLSSFHQIFKCIIPTILKQNINIFFIFESLNKLNNVFMFESFMNFNLN